MSKSPASSSNYPKLNSEVKEYRHHYRKAIIDALNTLGAATACPDCSCEGCQYERSAAMSILYGSLGLKLSFKDPQKSFRRYSKLRDTN